MKLTTKHLSLEVNFHPGWRHTSRLRFWRAHRDLFNVWTAGLHCLYADVRLIVTNPQLTASQVDTLVAEYAQLSGRELDAPLDAAAALRFQELSQLLGARN
jgi:hypothetical protein